MFLPVVHELLNTREMTSNFYGYNHNLRIADGEWYDCENLTSDDAPLMAVRDPRPNSNAFSEKMRGILLTDKGLVWLTGQTLRYNDVDYDISADIPDDDGESDVQLMMYGAYILIFPIGWYLNTVNPADRGSLAASYTTPASGSVTYQLSTLDGTPVNPTVAQTAPGSPADGAYWLDTKNNALMRWDASSSMWLEILTTYIKIILPTGTDLTGIFEEGDAVYLDTPYPDINEGSVIRTIGDGWFVVIGLLNAASATASGSLTIERRMPDLDFACVSDNRVWGCRYAADEDGDFLNEIYASKLGDPKNWFVFDGLASDSYSVSIGTEGAWTGCITYQGYPTFFKENAIYRIFGKMPSEYQLSTLDCRGVQAGSEHSIAICGEYLLYKSVSDVCIFDGSTPVSISDALGKQTQYYKASAGVSLGKYHISMMNSDNVHEDFVWDMEKNLWMRESGERILQYSNERSGRMYGTDGTKIHSYGLRDNDPFYDVSPDEQIVSWFAESGEYGFEYPDHKYLKAITIRATIPFQSEIRVEISYDDENYEELGSLRGSQRVTSQQLRIRPRRCDHYRLKLSGQGPAKVYSITRTFATGSEK